MKKIQRRAALCTIILLTFTAGMLYFLGCFAKDSSSWYIKRYNRFLYTAGGELLSGTICDCNGVTLSQAEDGHRTYHEDADIRMATLQLVGDPESKIGASVLSTYQDLLVDYHPIAGRFSTTLAGNTCHLTIDSELCAAAYRAMDGKNGTVAVYNYQTGEIVCLVSTPTYDPLQIPNDLETNPAYSGAYQNRFFSSVCRPGSVMKTVTLQTVLENLPDAASRTYTCKGQLAIGDNTVYCERAHGTMTLEDAFACSCNCVFAELSLELGGQLLANTVRSIGLTKHFQIDAITSAAGSFELVTADDYQLGYAGVGLYLDLVNPCSLLMYYGAIAGGGTTAVPYYVSSITDSSGKAVYTHEPAAAYSPLSAASAAALQPYLENNVLKTYKTDRFPKVTMGAKSGTIESASGLSDCWFVGYLRDPAYPYAFLVYLENAGSGNHVAGTVAGKVLMQLVNP